MYGIIGADTLLDLAALTFDFLSVVVHGGSRDQPLDQVWRSYVYQFLSYEFWHLPKDAIEHGFAATAHAPYHVTYAYGANFPPYLKSLTPFFAYSLYNFYGATMTFRGRLLLAPVTLKLVSADSFQVPSKSGAKMAVLGGKGYADVLAAQRGTSLCRTAPFDVFSSMFVVASCL